MSLTEWTKVPTAAILAADAFAPVYEGEDDTPPAAGEGETPPPAEDKDKGKAKVKLTPEQQAFVNSLLAEERRKAQVKNEQLITQLETEKNRSGTTAAEKQQLEDRIEQLKNEFATKDELQKREVNKRIQELEQKNKSLEAEGSTWKQRYDRDRKRIDLTQAAATEKAYNPRQVVNELFPNARLVETVGEDGKGTGEYETRVKISTVDKEGKPVTLDLDPVGAVKQLKEMSEFQNLFISPATGGLGGGNLGKGGSGGSKPMAEMTTEEFMAARRKARREGRS
jgi:hypothetical protein